MQGMEGWVTFPAAVRFLRKDVFAAPRLGPHRFPEQGCCSVSCFSRGAVRSRPFARLGRSPCNQVGSAGFAPSRGLRGDEVQGYANTDVSVPISSNTLRLL